MDKAEIADQQVAPKLTETGRGKSNAPRRGEGTADDRFQQGPVLIENRDRSCSRSRIYLVGSPTRRCISHIQISVDALHVERNKSQRTDRSGRCKRASAEAHRGEGAIED